MIKKLITKKRPERHPSLKRLSNAGTYEDMLRSLERQMRAVRDSIDNAKDPLANELFEREMDLLKRRKRQLLENPSGVSQIGKEFAPMKYYPRQEKKKK